MRHELPTEGHVVSQLINTQCRRKVCSVYQCYLDFPIGFDGSFSIIFSCKDDHNVTYLKVQQSNNVLMFQFLLKKRKSLLIQQTYIQYLILLVYQISLYNKLLKALRKIRTE